MLHRNIDEALNYLPGSFSATALKLSYMGVCLDSKVELALDEYPVLRLLVEWSDFYPTLHNQSDLTLNEVVFQNRDPTVLTSFE